MFSLLFGSFCFNWPFFSCRLKMKWMKSMQRFSLSWNANCRIERHLLITQPRYINSTWFNMLRPHCQQLHLFAHATYVLCSCCIAPCWKTHIAYSSVLKLSSNKSRYHAVTTVNVCSELCILSINTVFLKWYFHGTEMLKDCVFVSRRMIWCYQSWQGHTLLKN